jgi:myo-inositol-1(or 4)-monophosphatase
MIDFQKELLALDKQLKTIFKEHYHQEQSRKKEKNINVTLEHSLRIDLLMEDTIINFFSDRKIPCIIEAEERGRTIIESDPQFVIIADPLDGSNNFRRGIPLSAYGIGIAKIGKNKKAFFSNMLAAAVRIFNTEEYYYAQLGRGAYCNNKRISPSKIKQIEKAMIAFDLDRFWYNEHLVQATKSVLERSRGSRRFGANLIDMVYVAAGKLEAMIDLRNSLSVIHTPGLFIAKESGAMIGSLNKQSFEVELVARNTMSFTLANNEKILRQITTILKKEKEKNSENQ